MAELLGYVYVDTGAMYRALALKAQRLNLPLDAEERLAQMAGETHIDLHIDGGAQKILLDGEDVTSAIRSPEVAQASSKIAVIPGVRRVLVAEQRRAGQLGGVVMEGPTSVPSSSPTRLKIYLTASVEVRAQRRWREHQQKGDSVNLERTIEEVRERDRRDVEREHSRSSARPTPS